MAFIVCPLVGDWYLRFRAGRSAQYTSYQVESLRMFQEMLRPGTGWLRQKPHLASRLIPLNLNGVEMVSPEFIARASRDWDKVCDEAIEE
jgi:hypothetical protein